MYNIETYYYFSYLWLKEHVLKGRLHHIVMEMGDSIGQRLCQTDTETELL